MLAGWLALERALTHSYILAKSVLHPRDERETKTHMFRSIGQVFRLVIVFRTWFDYVFDFFAKLISFFSSLLSLFALLLYYDAMWKCWAHNLPDARAQTVFTVHLCSLGERQSVDHWEWLVCRWPSDSGSALDRLEGIRLGFYYSHEKRTIKWKRTVNHWSCTMHAAEIP